MTTAKYFLTFAPNEDDYDSDPFDFMDNDDIYKQISGPLNEGLSGTYHQEIKYNGIEKMKFIKSELKIIDENKLIQTILN